MIRKRIRPRAREKARCGKGTSSVVDLKLEPHRLWRYPGKLRNLLPGLLEHRRNGCIAGSLGLRLTEEHQAMVLPLRPHHAGLKVLTGPGDRKLDLLRHSHHRSTRNLSTFVREVPDRAVDHRRTIVEVHLGGKEGAFARGSVFLVQAGSLPL